MAAKAKPLNERAWIRQVIGRYEELDKLQPVIPGEREEPPDWVYGAMKPLVVFSHPKLNLVPFRKWTIRDLGYFLGRQSALDKVMWGEVPLSREIWQGFDKCVATLPLDHIPNWPKAVRILGAGMVKWRVIFRKFIEDVLAEARSRPYLEASLFMKAFVEGETIGDADFDDSKLTERERIAWVMALYWRPISKFQSVAELYRLLAHAAKPMGIQITLKRIEALCRRIGLRFKSRGRPKNPARLPAFA